MAFDWPQMQRAVEQTSSSHHGVGRLRRMAHLTWPDVLSLPPAIYILTFHSVVDPGDCEPWEMAYDKGAVTVETLTKHLEFLSRHTTPIALSKAITLKSGDIDRPYLALTFDDGYRNALTNAAPVVHRLGHCPTLFVNGGFAEGIVYYRVLAALLTKQGHAPVLASELRRRVTSVSWSADPATLFHQTKDEYTKPGMIEEATEIAFGRVLGNPSELHVHLQTQEVSTLTALGWEIGNHTYRHHVLDSLAKDVVAGSIERNEAYWKSQGFSLLPCLAFPNGAAKHVGIGIKAYLDERQDLHGMFCNGGVNLVSSRTEWLRIPVSNMSVGNLASRLATELHASRRALEVLGGA